jgi:membrane fusion protein (multidrug efflux system)
MKTFRLIQLIGLPAVATLVLALSLSGCGKGAPDKPTPPPVAVTFETVTNRLFVRLLTVTGTIEPTTVAGLASPAEGPVLGCRVREGDRVTAGQELLRIGRQLSAAAAQAAAREELRRQEQEFRRIEALVKEKAIAGDQLDTARAALERARAALAQAEQAADDYSIRAPWAGVVSRVRVADGNYVAPRTPLVDLYDPASLVLRFAVTEDHAFALAVDGRVQVTFDALPGPRSPWKSSAPIRNWIAVCARARSKRRCRRKPPFRPACLPASAPCWMNKKRC